MAIHDQSSHPIVQLMYLPKQRENTWGQDFFAPAEQTIPSRQKHAKRSRCPCNARWEWMGRRLRGPEWVKVLHCDRFEAMLTKPDAMGKVSKAEEHGVEERRRSSQLANRRNAVSRYNLRSKNSAI